MTTTVKDRGWKRIKRELALMSGAVVKIGVLSDAGKYSTGAGGQNLADVATINEYGSRDGKHPPSRPFMRQAIDRNKAKIRKATERLQSAIYKGNESTRSALEKLGAMHVGHVQKIFRTGRFKANKQSTKDKKGGSGRPLIDTGRLSQSIASEVDLG